MPNISGIERVRTMKTTHSRSMPPNMDEPYVEMYMLNKEKERLEKEGTRLDTRREVIAGRLREIEEEMERLQGRNKKVQKKRKLDWEKMKEEASPEEPEKQKIATGWKIKTLKRKKEVF